MAGALAPAIAGTAPSRAPALVRVSSDPITKAGQEHATEAEPDTIAVEHKVLSSFMVGNVPTCTDASGPGQQHGRRLGRWAGGRPSTSGASARLGLYYYYFPKLPCTVSTCRVFLGYTSSSDGGSRWSTPRVIAGPMKLTQFGDPFPGAHYGGFAGDYVGASATPEGNAVAVFPLGLPATTQKFNEPMQAVAGGEPIAQERRAGTRVAVARQQVAAGHVYTQPWPAGPSLRPRV